MAAVNPNAIPDLVKLTQDKFERGKWTDIALSYPHYTAAEIMANKNRISWAGGLNYQFVLQIDYDDNARYSGMYDTDRNSQKNLAVRATVAATKITTNMSYDIDEPCFQGGSMTEIVDYLKMKIHSKEQGFFTLVEQGLWGTPTSSSQDPMPIYGIPFWVQKATSGQTTFAIRGGNPSGFSSGCAGVSSSTYANWANGNAVYSAVSRADLIAKWREASVKSEFITPHSFSELGAATGNNYGYYTTYRVMAPLEEALESRNDNLGVDLAKYQGSVLFRGNPVKYVPYLDTNDTSDPVYGINWNTMKFLFVEGRYRMKTPFAPVPGRHSVMIEHDDTWMNTVCHNRRGNFVLNKV